MDRRTLNLGILSLGAGLVLPSAALAADVDIEDAVKPRVLGDPDAPIHMIEYSSMTCPHCAKFHSGALPEIKTAYIETGKLKLEMRDFPLDQYALRASAMARKVSGTRYFSLIDQLFKQQAAWARAQNPIDALKKIGRFAGIKPDVADAYMNSEALIDAILNDRLKAQREHDVSSTPTFIINNKHKIAGAYPFSEFQKVIEGELV